MNPLATITGLPSAAARRAGRIPPATRRLITIVLSVLLVLAAAAAVTSGAMSRQAHAVEQARFDAVTQARQRVARILSYNVTTIDADIERAQGDTAGAFAQYYAPFARQAIAPAVRQQRTISVAVVSRAAAISATQDKVVVLLFIDQQTSSQAQPQPRGTTSTAQATMTKIAGQWLVSELTPSAP